MPSSSTLVAVGIAAVLLGDGLAWSYARAAEREQTQQVEAQWRASARAVAVEVGKARAPLGDAANLFLLDDDLASGVRYDVYVRGTASADLAAAQQQLSAIRPPATRTDEHRRLLAVLTDLVDATEQLRDGADTDIEDELDAYTAAAAAWDRLVFTEVARDVPSVTTLGEQQGPLSATGVLFRWSFACAEAEQAYAELDSTEDAATAAEAARVLADGASVFDSLLTELEAVRGPDELEVRLERDVRASLRGLRAAVTTTQELAAALREEQRESVRDALVQMDRLSPVFERAGDGMEGFGSSVCSALLDPGLLAGGATGQDPEPTRT